MRILAWAFMASKIYSSSGSSAADDGADAEVEAAYGTGDADELS
jgi:hypothetical protein